MEFGGISDMTVTRLKPIARGVLVEGSPFGSVGAYEEVMGTSEFAIYSTVALI